MLAKLAGWEADPIGFGHLYRGRFGSRAEWEQWDWDERVKELTVTVEAQMRVRRYGLISGPDRVGDGR